MAVWPAQSVVEDALTFNVTFGVTLIVNVFGVPVQPPKVPVTVYTVVDVGVNTLIEPEPDGSQLYEMAPDTLTLTAVPLQIVVLVTEVTSVGVAVTFTVTMVLVLPQLPLAPVRV